jgi:hypothetical protein
MKRIKFNGQIHSFPDDVTEEEINQTLGGNNNEPSLLNKIGTEAEGALHMPLGRSLKNIGQGTVDLGEFITNPAGPMMKYLASKDIPYVSAGAKHWPQYPESDMFGLGEKQPGDTIFQAITPTGPAIKGAQFAGKSLEQLVKMTAPKIAKVAEKAGDKLPVLKSIASKPYEKQMNILEEKGLLEGYKPNDTDVLESARILTSKGMKIPHEAVNEAVAQTLEGNFKPWFDLQSSVRSEGRRLSKMGGVNRSLGEKLHGLAEKMHTEMGEAQAARGAPEAERLMHQGKERFARYHKISPISRGASKLAAGAALPTWLYKMLKSFG